MHRLIAVGARLLDPELVNGRLHCGLGGVYVYVYVCVYVGLLDPELVDGRLHYGRACLGEDKG